MVTNYHISDYLCLNIVCRTGLRFFIFWYVAQRQWVVRHDILGQDISPMSRTSGPLETELTCRPETLVNIPPTDNVEHPRRL